MSGQYFPSRMLGKSRTSQRYPQRDRERPSAQLHQHVLPIQKRASRDVQTVSSQTQSFLSPNPELQNQRLLSRDVRASIYRSSSTRFGPKLYIYVLTKVCTSVGFVDGRSGVQWR